MPNQLPELTPRESDSHKGDYGRALLIGGSRGMGGAIALSGMAALRGGAGLVTLATSSDCLSVVAGFEPSYMTTGLACDTAGRIARECREHLRELAESSDCVAIGPGLGKSEDLTELVCSLYQSLPQPVVVDADALNALASRRESLPDHAGPRVLTPHPGEFRRLSGEELRERDEQESQAADLARSSRVVIVLKGHHTLVTDGDVRWRNTTGNPGMATGGTGDVLTGIVTALICQNLQPYDAACLAVYLHGLAGDLAAEQLGQESIIARDLVEHLSAAFRRYRSDHGS